MRDQLKTISINIGGDLYRKVEDIKKFMTKQKPDILCLVETHTFYEDYSKIKGWFENKHYKVFYTAVSQKEYYNKIKNIKVKEIEQHEYWTQREKEVRVSQWEANTQLHTLRYPGGVVVIVKSHLKEFFTETNMIPDNRGITLHSSKLEPGYNTFLHFVYGPPTSKESGEFWESVRKALNKKPSPKNTHFIIGDLNVHMDKHLDAGSSGSMRRPKALKQIIRDFSLVDTYRTENKNKRVPTYYRVEGGFRVISSRVDYILAPQEGSTWHTPRIYSSINKVSKDHHPIGATIVMTMCRPHMARPPIIKTKRMNVKKLEEEAIQAIGEQAHKNFSGQFWSEFLATPPTEVDLEQANAKYLETVWEIAENTIKVTEKTPFIHLKPFQKDKDIQHLETQHTLLLRALMASPLSAKTKTIPKAFQKLARLTDDYKINVEIDQEMFSSDPDLLQLRIKIQDSILKVRKDLETTNRKITHKFIEGRVDAIRLDRCDDPGKFFARAQPDSVFRSQQLWAVDYQAVRRKRDGTTMLVKASSSIPTIVSREVKKAWEKVFSSKKPITTELHDVFNSPKFKERRERIHNQDGGLIQSISIEEVLSTIKKLSNGTACGPDNIPNEIIKHMGASPKFVEVLTHLFRACMAQQKIPSTWKKSNIFTTYKKDNPNNPLNYRPIALLCTTYKLYVTIITGRLTNFMEENKCFSEMQGGFRRDRPTFAKMWTLRNIIEHAKINNKELHACYIDIQKAYDSVEYWALDRVLEEYGFSEHFRDIISDISRNSTCNVILPHGLSDTINITRGVRQGCPLSPVLFTIFLEPLMLKLEGMKRGYTVDEGEPIPGGAYADDMVLHAGTRIDLQKLLNECAKYFDFVGLDIAVDGRDKSVYTSNTGPPNYSQRLKFTTHKNGITETKHLPYYESWESYKYLGLWINLDLNWEKQTQITNGMYAKYLSSLYKKCFTASQTAEILNLVVFPSITYRMNLIKYDNKAVSKWDQKARNLMGHKLRENQNIGCKHWYLPNNQYGYNLFKLADLQKICLSANFLSYAANFIDTYAVRSTKAVFGDSEVIEQVGQLLKKCNLHIVWNPTHQEGYFPEHPSKYLPNYSVLRNLMQAGVHNLNELIQDNNELITLEHFNETFEADWDRRKYNHLKKQICHTKDTIKESILKGLNRYHPWEFNAEHFYYDEEMGGYEIYVDETLKKQKGKPDKAGYGIYIGKKHQYNLYDRVEGEQTLQNATYQGILHVLKGFPLDEPIVFGIDRKAVIDDVIGELSHSVQRQTKCTSPGHIEPD